MAQGGRLDRFGAFSGIHTIVEASCGAYTHDEVFELDAVFVKQLLLMLYEKEMYKNRLVKARIELDKE